MLCANEVATRREKERWRDEYISRAPPAAGNKRGDKRQKEKKNQREIIKETDPSSKGRNFIHGLC